MEDERRIQNGRENRNSVFPPSFLEHAPKAGVDTHVARVLGDRGFDITFSNSRISNTDDLVEIHGNNQESRDTFFKVLAMPEVLALMFTEEPSESSDSQLIDQINQTPWDKKTKRRVHASMYKSAAEQWRRIYEHERSDTALQNAQQNERWAEKLLPEGTEHLTEREKQALVEEAVSRAISGQ